MMSVFFIFPKMTGNCRNQNKSMYQNLLASLLSSELYDQENSFFKKFDREKYRFILFFK